MRWNENQTYQTRQDLQAYHIYHVTLLRRGAHPARAASLMSSTLCSRPPSRSWVESVQGGMFRQESCIVDYRQVAHNSCILMYESLILYELSCEHVWVNTLCVFTEWTGPLQKKIAWSYKTFMIGIPWALCFCHVFEGPIQILSACFSSSRRSLISFLWNDMTRVWHEHWTNHFLAKLLFRDSESVLAA